MVANGYNETKQYQIVAKWSNSSVNCITFLVERHVRSRLFVRYDFPNFMGYFIFPSFLSS